MIEAYGFVQSRKEDSTKPHFPMTIYLANPNSSICFLKERAGSGGRREGILATQACFLNSLVFRFF